MIYYNIIFVAMIFFLLFRIFRYKFSKHNKENAGLALISIISLVTVLLNEKNTITFIHYSFVAIFTILVLCFLYKYITNKWK